MSSIETFLQNTSDSLDNNRLLGKIRFSPFVSQRVVFDDNIFLNDEHENDTIGREWDMDLGRLLFLVFLGHGGSRPGPRSFAAGRRALTGLCSA